MCMVGSIATSPTKRVPSADEEVEELKTGEFVMIKLAPFSPFKVDVTATGAKFGYYPCF